MRRIMPLGLCGLFLALLLCACDSDDPTEPGAPTDAFLEWVEARGFGSSQDAPRVGLLLGEVEAGQVISAYVPAEETARSAGSTLEEAGWLYYLDEAPGAFYQHPGQILVLGGNGRVLHQETTMGWPLVDGVRPSALDSPTSDAYFAAMVWNPWGLVKPVLGVKDWAASNISMRIKGAVVVMGLRPSEDLYAEANGIYGQVLEEMRNLYGADNVKTLPPKHSGQDTPLDRIDRAIFELVALQDVTNVTIYMIGHGDIGSLSIDGDGFTAQGLRIILSRYPEIMFSVLVESCYSGNFLAYFRGDRAMENVGLVAAASTWDKPSWPDWDSAETASGDVITDFDPSDAYVEWTSNLLKNIAVWSTGERWQAIQAYAAANDIPTEWALYYHAFFSVEGSPSIPPSIGFSPGETTYVMQERTGVEVQSPVIYAGWPIWYSDTP